MKIPKQLFLLGTFFALAPATVLAQGGIVTSTVEPGAYSAFEIYGPRTGMAGEDGIGIGGWDNPDVFTWPTHVGADLLWFTSGFLTWEHPVASPGDARVDSLSYTVEVSSEAGGASFSWPSDLTVSVNGVPIGTWTIPGDPNALYDPAYVTPNNLGFWNSQYGWLTKWTVDATGTYFDAEFRNLQDLGLGPVSRFKISDTTVNDIAFIPGEPVKITLSVPGPGGLNLYGDTWGDYPVDPTLTVQYHRTVAVDIKPGSYPNPINPGATGVMPVAILSSAIFDATTVDPATVTLAGAGVAVRGKNLRYMAAAEDVNADGLPDLLLHVETENLNPALIQNGFAVLSGATSDGTLIQGQDEVKIVPKR